MTKTKRRVSREQRLRDDVAYAASCLKEAGDPLHHLGPSGQYEDAFQRYSKAMHALLAFDCPLGIEEWTWDGYAGTFHFKWVFGAQARELGSAKAYETRYINMTSHGRLDDSKLIDEELVRLRAEAVYLDEMRRALTRWSHDHVKGAAK